MRRFVHHISRLLDRTPLAVIVASLALSNAAAQDGLHVVDLGRSDRGHIQEALGAHQLRWVGVLGSDLALIRGDRVAISDIPDLRYVEPFISARKATPALAARIFASRPAARGFQADYIVIPADRSRETRARLAALAASLGGSAGLVDSDALTMRVRIDDPGLRLLLDSPDVVWAEHAAEPEADDEFVREFGGANYVELLDGFTGAGVVCEVVDGGLLETHADFAAAPPIMLTANTTFTEHGTSTYGLLFGSGASDLSAIGMIPDAVGLFSSYHHIDDRDAHLAMLESPPYLGVLQSNSWGSGINRRYTAVSAEVDDAIFRHGVVVLQSQSNTGSPDSRPEAWAKNVVSVGGVQGKGTLDRADDTWGGVASTGPALDGRVKPDLVLFNDGIWTPNDTGDTDHHLFTGTSAATPAVAGHFGIMLEMFDAGMFNQPAEAGRPMLKVESQGSGQGVRSPPRVATAKALMINSARPYDFTSAADDLGRFRQGWGTPDLRRLRDNAPLTFVLDGSEPLVQGESWGGVFNVAQGQTDLRVTLVYNDPAALPMAVSAIVNDLDLRLTSPSGVVYHGNAGLIDGPWSVPGGSPDRVNTVENVFVPQPEPGPWLIDVRAFRVNEDADTSTPEFDVPFSLVASGGSFSASPTLVPLGEIPAEIPANTPVSFEFRAVGFTPVGDGEVILDSLAGPATAPLVWTGGDRFGVTFNSLPCGSISGFRFSATTPGGGEASYPPGPDASVAVEITKTAELTPTGSWQTDASAGLTMGGWVQGTPAGGGLRFDPPVDADGDGVCWLTDNRAGTSDISGGSAVLTSPVFDVDETPGATLEYDLWLACDNAGTPAEDTLTVEFSVDDGQSWTPLRTERSTFRWVHRVVDFAVPPGSTVLFRFTIADDPDDSITEAAIDGLAVRVDICVPCPADFDGDGDTDLTDVNLFATAFQMLDPAADLDLDGDVDLADLFLFLLSFDLGC